ncbi:MAG: hypothetical protein MJ097_06180 [Dorea sp.]|nr:hypothetical protein [Dorea sp.]
MKELLLEHSYNLVGWIAIYIFIREFANPQEREYNVASFEMGKGCFIEPSYFRFLFDETYYYPRYRGVLKSRYYTCFISFALWCVDGLFLFLGLVIGPEVPRDFLMFNAIVMAALIIIYAIPYETINLYLYNIINRNKR